MSLNFLLTITLFILFIPNLFITLPPCSKDQDDFTSKVIVNITHAVCFTIVLFVFGMF